MPVKFKVIERGQPGVSGGGDKKWYASPNMSGEKTLTDLTKDIEKISTVSGADIRAVLYALVDVMQSSLANGQIVRLGELGSLRVSFSSEGKATEKEVTVSAIKQAKVIFTPAKGIKDTLATLTYEKV
ncbi:HU family DNA-binding protein [Riemerella anatipestifer]|uniref:HU family DNA-binding protein n=1 Tax=Riemerella anatipestifer TaxID=34085 RepID=UPI003DA9B1C3